MADEPEVTQQRETRSPGGMLADGLYGKTNPDPEVTPQDPPPADPPPDDPAMEADPEGDPEAVADPEEGTEVATAADDDQEVKSFEELAEHLELDPEWFRGLAITEKVNGKEVQVTLADALSTHRKVKAADTYLSEAKTKSKAILEDANQQKDALQSTVATLGKLVETLEDEYQRDTKGIDWAKLREDDPAEYSARREEIRDRKARLDEIKSQAAQALSGVTEKTQQHRLHAMQERLPEERQALLERVPEWKDTEKAEAERGDLVNYLSGDGFSENEIRAASFNGKVLALAIKAMRYDKSKSKANSAGKKVRRVPKVLKPGGGKPDPKPNGKDKGNNDPASILYG